MSVTQAPPVLRPRARSWRLLAAGLVLLGLGLCFRESVLAYAADEHYQAHFSFLWVFFAAALVKGTRGRTVWRTAPGVRTGCGIALAATGALLLHAGLVTGSSTVQRLSLVVAFTAALLVAVAGWSTARCLAYGLFALLCFGIPYSAYFWLTKLFRQAFVVLLAGLPAVTPFDFQVDGLALRFPDYTLAITPECSGFNQLLTFVGLAMLGSLTGRPSWRRTALLFGLGALLAYAANLARVLVFVALVAARQYQFVARPGLHQLTGFAAYTPFLLLFLWVILRTHRPLPPPAPPVRGRRGLPVAVLLVPYLAVRLLHLQAPEPSAEPPRYMADLRPPGYVLVERSPSESREREVYGTPWLLNATFADPAGDSVEVFAYLTRSRRQLAVHQIAQCLEVPGVEVTYGPPVTAGGRRFWTLELSGERATYHGYFSFWVDGEDRDDSFGTQLAVFWQRLGRGVEEVGLTRFLLPGPLVLPVPARDAELLAWRAGQLAGGDAAAPR